MDEELVSLVRQFNILYDKCDPLFKDNIAKQNAWCAIAKVINENGQNVEEVTEEQCKTCWNVLRNKFNVERRNIKNVPSGSGANATISTWKLYGSMEFLNMHVKERQTKGNVKRKNTTPIEILSPSGSSTSLWDENNYDVVTFGDDENRQIPQYIVETPPTKKRKVDDGLNTTLQKAMAGFDEFCKRQEKPNNVLPDQLFGESVGAEISQIQDRAIKSRLKRKIMQLIEESVEEELSLSQCNL